MLLIKRMSAWDFLDYLTDNDSVYEKIGDLFTDILDSGKEDALDNVISHEFPNGVEEDELTEFFINNQDFIREELGIEKDD